MSTNIKSRLAAIRDLFSYLIVASPNFPPEDQTTVEMEFTKMRQYLSEVAAHLRRPTQQQWLRLAISEVDEARESFLAGDENKGNDLLHTAEEHFLNAVEGKSSRPTFVVGPTGRAKKL